MKKSEEIKSWLREKIALETNNQPESIATNIDFTEYGLDSIVIVTLVDDLETWLSVSLDPTIFWEYPSIDILANWLITKKLTN